jgi:hypothetical protein
MSEPSKDSDEQSATGPSLLVRELDRFFFTKSDQDESL